MLQITKIIEGGIDLTSGEQISQGLVVTNGLNEVTIPVSQTSLESVVRLYAQMVEVAQRGGNGIELSEEDRETVESWKTDEPQMRATSPAPVLRAMPGPPAEPPEDFEYEEPPPSSDISDDDGFEPGEDYADSGTGVGSL